MILITAWLAVVFFGLMMCRLAARSDDSHAVELADLIAKRHTAGRGAPFPDTAVEQRPFDAQPDPYRATG
ncbi:MAG TPA: hypothetical protein VNZ01_12935 [Solirubrobacteraceae bacterium]|nr:hypothetical protein [Solirubrobacteraceae bacterium]